MSEFHPAEQADFPGLRQRADSGVWYFYGRRKGRVVKRSFETCDLAEAKTKYFEAYGREYSANSKITVEAAYDLYRLAELEASEDTLARYHTAFVMDVLNDKYGIGKMPVDKVRSTHIADVLAGAKKRKTSTGRKLAENTRRNIYVAMSALFKWCAEDEQGYCLSNPVAKLSAGKRPKIVTRSHAKLGLVVSIEETDRIAEAAAVPAGPGQNATILAKQMRVIILLLPLIGSGSPRCSPCSCRTGTRWCAPTGG